MFPHTLFVQDNVLYCISVKHMETTGRQAVVCTDDAEYVIMQAGELFCTIVYSSKNQPFRKGGDAPGRRAGMSVFHKSLNKLN